MKSSKNLFAVCTLALLGGALFSCEEPKPADPAKTFTTQPAELVFEAGGDLTATATVTTNIDLAQATITIPTDAGWILSAEFVDRTISVEVAAFEGVEGAQNRSSQITVSSPELGADYILKVTQEPALILDIAGEWVFSAASTITPNGNVIDYTGGDIDITIEYVKELGIFRFDELPFEDQFIDNGAGLALRTDSKGNVTFIAFDKTGLYEPEGWSGTMAYRNMAYAHDKDAGLFPALLDKGTEVALQLSTDGNTITFPTTYTYDGNEVKLACGVGYLSLADGEVEGEEDEDGMFEPVCVYNGIVLTKK